MPLFKWSKTAASNATADPTINWQEGMAPSAVNDSARAEMAAVKKWHDDITGMLTTSGSSTAYAVTTNSGFDSLANLAGSMVAFVPHTTSGDGPTLNVDGLGAKPIRMAPNVPLPAGVLVQGTPYVATYYTANGGEFILHGFYGNPYNLPIGGGMPFFGTTAPNSAFAFPFGQAISRTTYATLFAMVGTTYGTGDGSTTFNVPDLRGRVLAGKDDMGGTSANRLTNQSGGLDGDVLGATGGSETHTLTEAQLPAHTHGVGTLAAGSDGSHTHRLLADADGDNGPTRGLANAISGQVAGGATAPSGYQQTAPAGSSQDYVEAAGSHTHALSGLTAAIGSGGAHNNVQPTIIVNYILRII